MYEYIKHKIKKLNSSVPLETQVSVIKSIYTDLEDRGFHHAEIYTMITQVILENIKEYERELKKLKEE